MEFREKKTTDLFESTHNFIIPFYQRSYVWKEDSSHTDLSRFADDMEELSETNPHFLGTLILKEFDKLSKWDEHHDIKKKYEVVDGQQRITTIALYLKALYNLYGSTGVFRNSFFIKEMGKDDIMIPSEMPIINHNFNDKQAFDAIMQNTGDISNVNEGTIRKAYQYFIDRYKDFTKDQLCELIDNVRSYVVFATVFLDEKEDHQKIFDTINSLGEPLTTDELLKNYLYKQDEKEFFLEEGGWHHTFEGENRIFWGTDNSKTSQKKDVRLIDTFLFAYMKYKRWSFPNLEAPERFYRKEANVYKGLTLFVQQKHIERLELARDIIEKAKLFRKYFAPSTLDNPTPQEFGLERLSCLMNASKSFSALPYIFYVLDNTLNTNEQNAIFRIIEVFLIRRMLCNSNSKDITNLFSEYLISNKLNTADGLLDYFNKHHDGNNGLPTQEEVTNGIMNKSTVSPNIVLYMYHTLLGGKNAFNEFKVFEVMPKPTNRNSGTWPRLSNQEDEDMRRNLISTIGNQVLLKNPYKRHPVDAVANKTITEKLKSIRDGGYAEGVHSSELFICKQDGVYVLSKWDSSDIRKRNISFADSINKIWIES